MSVGAIRPEAIKSFAYVLGVYLGDGAVTRWRMAGKADRLVFRLNTIDEDFAKATRAALADLSDYKVSLSCHPVPKSNNPNWALALGDRVLCERLIADTNWKTIIPPYVFDWSREMKLAFIVGLSCASEQSKFDHAHAVPNPPLRLRQPPLRRP